MKNHHDTDILVFQVVSVLVFFVLLGILGWAAWVAVAWFWKLVLGVFHR